jgi:predicted PurR-regulated permease PerM
LVWLVVLLQREGAVALREAVTLLRAGVELPEPVARLPWIGPWLQERLAELGSDREAWGRQLAEWGEQWGELIGAQVIAVLGDVGLNAMRFAVALLTAFFLFRDGDRLLGEVRRVLHGLLGERVDGYFEAVGGTTRAVVYGLLLWGALGVSWIDNLVRPMVISGVAHILSLLAPWREWAETTDASPHS